MKLSPEQLKQLAALSRLEPDAEQLCALEQDLAKMMTLAEQVQAAETEGDGLSHVHEHDLPLRDDEPAAPGDNLAGGAAEHQDGMVIVPKVID